MRLVPVVSLLVASGLALIGMALAAPAVGALVTAAMLVVGCAALSSAALLLLARTGPMVRTMAYFGIDTRDPALVEVRRAAAVDIEIVG